MVLIPPDGASDNRGTLFGGPFRGILVQAVALLSETPTYLRYRPSIVPIHLGSPYLTSKVS